MPNPESIQDKVRPILAAVEEYNINSRENSALDEDESNYQLNLEMPNGKTISLDKPSLALFHSDRSLYQQEIFRLKEKDENETLTASSYRRNKQTFEDLVEVTKQNKITPFIGAGVSISAGLLSWRSYLEQQAQDAGFPQATIKEYLDTGKYEELLEKVATSEHGGSFEFYFIQDFENANIQDSLAWLLPDLFDGCVITTNFDKVIEDSYNIHSKYFRSTQNGLGEPDAFIKALTLGKRSLLKLHGTLDTPSHRVFRQTEYDKAYTNNLTDKVSPTAPIPSLLRRVYRNHPLLFIGCSLLFDRTVDSFKEIVSTDNTSRLADHFAIVEAPEDEESFREKNNLLMECNIKPIWYEYGQHEKIGKILSLLKRRVL